MNHFMMIQARLGVCVNSLAINDMSSDERKCMFVLILYEVLLPIKKNQLIVWLASYFCGCCEFTMPISSA